MEKIERLLKKSEEVILDCSLPNGAIIAANTDHHAHPKDVQSYRYVWPRDAGYTCVAANALGIRDIQPKFFEWIIHRAEDFDTEGRLYQNYHTHGRKNWTAFQPDSGATVLWALHDYYKEDLKKALKLEDFIKTLADGICEVWDGNNFKHMTQELWEERFTHPEMKQNHTYTLAMCYKGLRCADEIIKNPKWVKVTEQMKKKIEKAYNGKYFLRTTGLTNNENIDASMLGLVQPSGIIKADDPRMVNTINMIEKHVTKNGGVYRYQFDEYDSFQFKSTHAKRGAGAWPILNFWMSIYYSEKDDKKKAEEYFNWVVDRVEDYIPEQIFENELQVSIKPLCWSHSMFVLASKKLGYIK